MPLAFFNSDDWYWQVTGDTNLWSSKRFMYVDPTDADYQTWLTLGGTITKIDTQDSLGAVMAGERIPSYIRSTGLAITSASNPALNATYALDDLTLVQVGTVARDAACAFGLPMSLSTFNFPDINSTLVAFSADEIRRLYIAMRDYVAGVNIAISGLVHGNSAELPDQPVEIG